MISRYITAFLAGAVVLACGGEANRPAVPADDDRQSPVAVGDTLARDPGQIARTEGSDGEAGTTGDGQARDGNGARAPDARSPGTAPPASGAGTPPSPGTQTPPPAAPAAGEQTASTDAILRATARTYEGVRSIQADFQQELRNPLLGQTTRSRGTLYQRQPDRFLMQFSDPDGDVIVSDGQYFWIYYPSVDARQVIRAPRGPQGMDMHSQFIGDPVSRFQATYHGRESVGGREAHVLTLVPREPLGYRSLKAWVDTRDHLVRRFELTEETGNVRRFELSNVQVNPTLPDRLFQFTPPAGAQVIQR
jgi:outer membrane lipoprotein carrier protein